MDYPLDGSQWLECACHTDEHTLRFSYIPDPDYPEVYLSIFMDEWGFWKRLWIGIKYVFGYKCKYGHFGCWTLREKDLDRLIGLLEAYKRDFKRIKEERTSALNERLKRAAIIYSHSQ
jgi:hypothetical protein